MCLTTRQSCYVCTLYKDKIIYVVRIYLPWKNSVNLFSFVQLFLISIFVMGIIILC